MKILIVDDEPDIQTYLSTIFEEKNHDVVIANNGIEGLEKANAEQPDLVTLDILMPEGSGIKLYRELRKSEKLKSVPIVIITGVASVAPAFRDFERFIHTRKIPGPDGYLEKPIKPEELRELVEKLIG